MRITAKFAMIGYKVRIWTNGSEREADLTTDFSQHRLCAKWSTDGVNTCRIEYGAIYGGWDVDVWCDDLIVAGRTSIVQVRPNCFREEWWCRVANGEPMSLIRHRTQEWCVVRWCISQRDTGRRHSVGLCTTREARSLLAKRNLALHNLVIGITIMELIGRDTFGPT